MEELEIMNRLSPSDLPVHDPDQAPCFWCTVAVYAMLCRRLGGEPETPPDGATGCMFEPGKPIVWFGRDGRTIR